VVLKSKTKDSVTVEIFGLITETYTVLKVLEFTSDRKCMSVIIDTPKESSFSAKVPKQRDSCKVIAVLRTIIDDASVGIQLCVDFQLQTTPR